MYLGEEEEWGEEEKLKKIIEDAFNNQEYSIIFGIDPSNYEGNLDLQIFIYYEKARAYIKGMKFFKGIIKGLTPFLEKYYLKPAIFQLEQYLTNVTLIGESEEEDIKYKLLILNYYELMEKSYYTIYELTKRKKYKDLGEKIIEKYFDFTYRLYCKIQKTRMEEERELSFEDKKYYEQLEERLEQGIFHLSFLYLMKYGSLNNIEKMKRYLNIMNEFHPPKRK